MYVKPVSRILPTSPSVVVCNKLLPVKFFLDEYSAICQGSAGLYVCNSSSIINPSQGLETSKLETLTEGESNLGKASLVSEILEIISSYSLKIQYYSGLDAAMVFNSVKGKGSLICRGAYFQQVALRQELYRQTATILDNILDSGIWRVFDIITVLWCVYAVSYGLVNFIIRQKVLDVYSCFLLFFTYFDQALNPISLTKSRFKFQLREMEAQF